MQQIFFAADSRPLALGFEQLPQTTLLFIPRLFPTVDIQLKSDILTKLYAEALHMSSTALVDNLKSFPQALCGYSELVNRPGPKFAVLYNENSK